MAQTLVVNYIHLVFSTKNREHLIRPEHTRDVFAYIAATLNKIDCTAIEVGGTTNHIHALYMLSKNKALKDVVRIIKSSSSAWITKRQLNYGSFEWQDGYGAFSLGESGLTRAIDYIRHQDEHHKRGDYESELRTLLEKYHLDFDERYLL